MGNVDFKHDPLWRTRLMSIQSIRDAAHHKGGHIFWRIAVPVVLTIMGLSYGNAIGMLLFR